MALMKPLYQQANTYDAVHDRGLIGDIFDVEGVIRPGGGALLVGPRPTANMSVDVAAGACVVAGDDVAGQGSYLCRSTAVENLPIGPAPGSNSRIDLVIARVRDATVTGGVSSDWLLEVIPGAVAAAPVAPEVPASAITLAQVLVPAGAATITAAGITDRRATAGSAAYASLTGQYDPALPSVTPSTYPLGLRVGTVVFSDGWPVTGTLTTFKRADTRTMQMLAANDGGALYARASDAQGTGWQGWRRLDATRYYGQTIDLPSIAANTSVNVDIATPGGIVAVGERVIYLYGLITHGLVMQSVSNDTADTIRLRISNVTGAAIDQAAVTFRFLITNPT